MASYRVVRQIGQGGMGAVFEAVHDQLERRAAIKVLLPEISCVPEMVARFFNEARAVNIVSHPGIVDTYELGQLDDGTVYIIMEFLEGESLTERLERQQGGKVREALRLARQVASALATAHRKGIIHRDLKPDNVFIVKDPDMPGGERAKVLDFGIAKMVEESRGPGVGLVKTRTGLVMGTPRYMSPEQCRGVGVIDDKVDVYALGVMLYQMLAGRTPFIAEGLGDLIVMQIHHTPQPLTELLPGCPDELAELVHAMLAKQPAQRPSMGQVLSWLDKIEGMVPEHLLCASHASGTLAVSPSMWVGDDASRAVPSPAPSAPQGVVAPPAGRPEAAPALSLPGDSASIPSLRPRSTSRWPLYLAALSVVGVAVGTAWLIRLKVGPEAERATGGSNPASLEALQGSVMALLEIDADLGGRRYEDAIRKADQVLATPGLSDKVARMARGRREQAQRELSARDTHAGFLAALDRKAYDEAMGLYHKLPRDSPYRAEAKPRYEKAFPLFARPHVQKARQARAQGRCPEFQEHIKALLQVEPEYPVALKAQRQGCGQPRESDDDDWFEEWTPEDSAAEAAARALHAPAQPSSSEVQPAEAPVPTAPVKETPQPPPVPKDPQELLREAQRLLASGDAQGALGIARALTGNTGTRRAAWLLAGTAACKLRDVRTVNEAYEQADVSAARSLLSACAQSGVGFSEGRFQVER